MGVPRPRRARRRPTATAPRPPPPCRPRVRRGPSPSLAAAGGPGRETLRAPPGRLLSWPGKVEAAEAAHPAASLRDARPPCPRPVAGLRPGPIAARLATAPATPSPRRRAAPARRGVVTPALRRAPSAPRMAAPPPAYFAAPTSGDPAARLAPRSAGRSPRRQPRADPARAPLFACTASTACSPTPRRFRRSSSAQTADLTRAGDGRSRSEPRRQRRDPQRRERRAARRRRSQLTDPSLMSASQLDALIALSKRPPATSAARCCAASRTSSSPRPTPGARR